MVPAAGQHGADDGLTRDGVGISSYAVVGLAAALAAQAPLFAAELHGDLDALLRKHVHDGAVDYAGLKRDEATLDAYLSRLDRVRPDALDRNGRLALWINGYNAFTLKLILHHYPGIQSIKDIPNRWDREDWRVGGRLYSLNQIEHDMLRKMGDPRIHFAIVCASKSCPALAPEAYQPETMDAQLTAAARRFLANPEKGLRAGETRHWLGVVRPVLTLSPLFKWFRTDFTDAVGDLLEFVLAYAPPDAQAFIRARRADLAVTYLDYDWSLNDRETRQ